MLGEQPFRIDGLKNRALAMLATTAGLLALSGVAPAVAAPPQHEVPAVTATTTSEADLATTVGPHFGFTDKGNPARFAATVTNNGPDRAVYVVVTATFNSITASFSGVLRDVDLEDVRDADLGDVLTAGNPAGWVRRGVMVPGLSRVVLRVSR